MGYRSDSQRVHQRRGMAYLAGAFERLIHVCQCSFWIAKHPQRDGPIRQDCHSDVLTEPVRQRAMLGGVVKRERLIVMRSAIHEYLPCTAMKYPRGGAQS